MPLITPTTVFVGARVFYREHALDYPNHSFCWSKSILQRACPCLPQPQFLLEQEYSTESMPLITTTTVFVGARVFYREHALDYPNHSFCWSKSILQRACPCLPQPQFLLEQEYSTESMPLITTTTVFVGARVFYREHALDYPNHSFCWSKSILQRACP